MLAAQIQNLFPVPVPPKPPAPVLGVPGGGGPGGGWDPRLDYDLDDIIAERNAWAYREAILDAPIALAPIVMEVSCLGVVVTASHLPVQVSMTSLVVSATMSSLDVREDTDG